MTITQIDSDPAKTNDKQVSYVTHPTLSEEVFRQFSLGIRNEPNIDIKFSLEGGLLVVHRIDLDGRDLADIEQRLSQAEHQIQRAHDRAVKEREEFLQHLANQTGRSVRAQTPVSETGGSAGDADKK